MTPGEIWRMADGTHRVVLSPATYNASALGRVITAVVGEPPSGFDPFAVSTAAGTVYADRLAMHPRHWLVERVDAFGAPVMDEVRAHLRFLLG